MSKDTSHTLPSKDLDTVVAAECRPLMSTLASAPPAGLTNALDHLFLALGSFVYPSPVPLPLLGMTSFTCPGDLLHIIVRILELPFAPPPFFCRKTASYRAKQTGILSISVQNRLTISRKLIVAHNQAGTLKIGKQSWTISANIQVVGSAAKNPPCQQLCQNH